MSSATARSYVLARNSTWSMSRETESYLHFASVSYYDGQGFMVSRGRNVDSALASTAARSASAGHYHGAQPCRLFPRQQHEIPGDEIRQAGRGVQGL